MLKESPQEKGCLSGCLTALMVGGGIGLLGGYLLSRYYLGSNPDRTMALFVEFGFLAFGFTVGAFLWEVGTWLYFRFKKDDEEEIV